jgi:hypothetical protein
VVPYLLFRPEQFRSQNAGELAESACSFVSDDERQVNCWVEGLIYSFSGKIAWGTMNRQEAVAILREIFEACSELIDMNYVSLNPTDAQIRKTADDNELHIKCALDERLRRCILPILEKHQLKMKESKGSIIIYSPK